MTKNTKFAFISFFEVFPSYSGASEVSSSFFNSWPNKNKRLFQISNKNNYKNNNIRSFKINFHNPFFKLLKIFKISNYVANYLDDSKHKIIIFEGASWIGYFYLLKKILLKKFPDSIIIYHSHNIEYELRRSKSNFIISYLTKLMEKEIFSSSHISTVVSKKDLRIVKRLYKVKPKILENGIGINYKNSNKTKIKLPKRFIFYSGSYSYMPNKYAINNLIENILPKVNLKFPDIKLVICGGGFNKNIKEKFLVNLGIISKSHLKILNKKAVCLVVPLKHGFGTRVKIIEALISGCKVVTTKKGVEGIDKKFENSAYKIANTNNHFVKLILKEIKKKTKYNNKWKEYYKKKYDMKIITKKFYNENFNK